MTRIYCFFVFCQDQASKRRIGGGARVVSSNFIVTFNDGCYSLTGYCSTNALRHNLHYMLLANCDDIIKRFFIVQKKKRHNNHNISDFRLFFGRISVVKAKTGLSLLGFTQYDLHDFAHTAATLQFFRLKISDALKGLAS